MDEQIISKKCTKCEQTLTLEHFSKHPTAKYGRNSVCIKCDSARVVAWQRANREKTRARAQRFNQKESTKQYRRQWMLENRYGITQEEFDVLKEQQGGRCAICDTECEDLHIDHDHLSGKVRGLLCGSCNRAIGLLKEDPAVVRKAVEYLEKNKCG